MMNNRTTRQRSLLTAAAVTGVLALAGTNIAMGAISGSKHDLSAGGGSQIGAAPGNTQTEICVFCHTPHGADTTAAAPLWNKTLPAPTSYTRYSTLNTSSMDALEAPVGSVSLACLSCHDGTQAMDVMINVPGSGMGTGTGTGGFEMSGTPVPNLGTDLSNDHPVSMQYAAGGPLASDTDGPYAGTLGDPDFFAPVKATINTQPVWWVDDQAGVGTINVRDKTDMQLFTRDEASVAGGKQPFVECASCHDPHSSNPTFLRIPNDGSDVCLSCHNK